MSVIEVDSFTSEVSAEAPSGPDVEYDPEYFDLEKLARGTPESQMGTETKPAEEPNWKDVREAAVKLSGRTRDLRVALILTLALLKQDGLPGFRDGVGVLRGFVEKLWDHFYPKLDPDDNNDPTIRVNLLKNLNGDGSAADMYKFKQRLKEATLTKSAQRIGAFGLRDVQVAKGEVPAPAAAEGQPCRPPPSWSMPPSRIPQQKICKPFRGAPRNRSTIWRPWMRRSAKRSGRAKVRICPAWSMS